jgi:DNA-binding IclR family transcriptional regulator
MFRMTEETSILRNTTRPRPGRRPGAVVGGRGRGRAGATPRGGLKSLHKTIRVLECFSIREPRLGLSEIARQVGLPASTAHRILTTLRAGGFVEQDGERDQYRLGLKLLELGSVVLATMELRREAAPVVEALARESGETVHLGVFDGAQVVSIEKMDSAHGLAMNVTIGKGAPAYCTGVGKALLAYQPEAVVDQVCRRGLRRHTAHTITDPRRLRTELERVREQGYAVDNEEHDLGVRCVAAPVRNHAGAVIASLSISGPTTRITGEAIPRLAERVREAAARLSAQLGHRG